MSININVSTVDYADFVTVVKSIHARGQVYFYNSAPARWDVWFAADDGAYLVQLVGATGTFPPTFATDFPAAISLALEISFSIG